MSELTTIIQEIFDEPDFESNGSLYDFTLRRGFNTHHIRIISRDWDYKVIEVLRKSDKIGEVKCTNYFKTLEELDLHLRNIRKGYHTFEFLPKF
jgi:hypothetical protein